MSTPTILSAVKKLTSLLTREEKVKGGIIIGFALCSAVFEVITASLIVVFAQVLAQPSVGEKYLRFLGIKPGMSLGHIVFYMALSVGGVYLIKNTIAAIEVFYQNFSIQRINYQFKSKLLRRYAETDYGFYLTRNSSLGLHVVGNEAEQAFSVGMVSLSIILSEGAVFLGLIILIVGLNPSLATSVFGFGAICFFLIMKGVLPRFYDFGRKLQETSLESTKHLLQFFQAFKEIILYGKQETFINSFDYYSRKRSQVVAMKTALNSLPRIVIEVLFVGLFILSVALLCWEHESPAQMIGILGGYLYVGFRLMPGLNRVIYQLNAFKSIIPSIEQVYNEYHNVPAKEHYLNVSDFKFEDSICFKDASFRYLNTKIDALKDISFKIQKGECLGIVGETGSSKSTFVDVLLGLLRPYAGSVLVDGKFPVNSYQWHLMIGYVPQSIYLRDDTIEANIAFGEQEVDVIKLEKAIDAAQLRKFIDKLPQGGKTIVGERGMRLSGGERQRIAIARALYHNPEVLIFDEATSALDNETEARLMETIHKVSKSRTVIMIAHRLTTLKECDRIIVMEGGSIQDITSYEALQKNKV